MTQHSATDDEIRALVNAVIAEVNPLRVILFGSRARGDQGENSDIDLLVIMPEGVDELSVQQDLCAMPRPGVNSAVDFVVTTPQSFERYRDSIGMVYRQVARDGRELYVA